MATNVFSMLKITRGLQIFLRNWPHMSISLFSFYIRLGKKSPFYHWTKISASHTCLYPRGDFSQNPTGTSSMDQREG